jgi:hypothetical protein
MTGCPSTPLKSGSANSLTTTEVLCRTPLHGVPAKQLLGLSWDRFSVIARMWALMSGVAPYGTSELGMSFS